MLRSPLLSHILALGLLAHAGLALAQQTPAATPNRPSDAPPKMEVVEEGSGPIVPRRQSGPKITEKKVGGVVTEVKVQTGKSAYTLKPNTPAGNAQPGDGQSNALRGPQWTVLEFDLNKKKKAESEAPADPALLPAPPPPTAK